MSHYVCHDIAKLHRPSHQIPACTSSTNDHVIASHDIDAETIRTHIKSEAVRMTGFMLNALGQDWQQHAQVVSSDSCCIEHAKVLVYTYTMLDVSWFAALAYSLPAKQMYCRAQSGVVCNCSSTCTNHNVLCGLYCTLGPLPR